MPAKIDVLYALWACGVCGDAGVRLGPAPGYRPSTGQCPKCDSVVFVDPPDRVRWLDSNGRMVSDLRVQWGGVRSDNGAGGGAGSQG